MQTLQKWFVAIAGVACFAIAPSHASTVIGFDDLPVESSLMLEDGYQGMDWFNWGVLNAQRPSLSGSGYDVAAGDSPNVAANRNAETAEFGRAGGFLLQSFDLTAAWNNDLNVTVTGLLNNVVVGSESFVISSHSPTTFNFNWTTVDRVTLSSFGGTSAGHNGRGPHVALDNLTVSAVPEPGTYALMLLGLTGIALVVRRRA